MNKEQLQAIVIILRDYLAIDDEHCYIYNQKWIIPKDGKLCVVIGLNNSRTTAVNKKYKKDDDKFIEQITLRQIQNISINIFSYNFEALDRKEEVIIALKTDKATNTFNNLGFNIVDIPNNFININETDGEKILYRYVINFDVYCGKVAEHETDYFKDGALKLKVDD
jgi:hypothetical protein